VKESFSPEPDQKLKKPKPMFPKLKAEKEARQARRAEKKREKELRKMEKEGRKEIVKEKQQKGNGEESADKESREVESKEAETTLLAGLGAEIDSAAAVDSLLASGSFSGEEISEMVGAIDSSMILDQLSTHDNEHVRYGVARNPHTLQHTIRGMARELSIYSRGDRSKGIPPSTPTTAISEAARNGGSDLYRSMCMNPGLTVGIALEFLESGDLELIKLLMDHTENPTIAGQLLEKPKTMAMSYGSEWVSQKGKVIKRLEEVEEGVDEEEGA
jgi:hypothetical protein